MYSQKIESFDEIEGFCLGYSPFGRPVMSVYCYLVDKLLIDTTASHTRKPLVEILKNRQVERIALTHYHEDHAGNAAFLSKKMSIPVLGHTETKNILAHSVYLRPYEKFMWGNLDPLEVTPIDTAIETANYKFTAVHTPGHSKDHFVYHEKKQGWLFSGDMYLGPRIKYFRKDECMYTTISSLKKILDLDFDVLLCGHNPQRKSGKKMLEKKYNYLAEIYITIQELAATGITRNEIMKQTTHRREKFWVKLITMGDVSFANLVSSALDSIEKGHRL